MMCNLCNFVKLHYVCYIIKLLLDWIGLDWIGLNRASDSVSLCPIPVLCALQI